MTSFSNSSRIFIGWVPSRVDAGPIVTVGLEHVHERERGGVAAHARIEQDDGEVVRLAVEVLEQARRAKEG